MTQVPGSETAQPNPPQQPPKETRWWRWLKNIMIYHFGAFRRLWNRILSSYLNRLGTTFFLRFKKIGRMQDLEAAIASYRRVLGLCPRGCPRHARSLNNLALAIHTRFEQTSMSEDLDELVALHRESVELYPPEHPNHSTSLNNLATVIHTRFKRTGTTGDLEEVITLYQRSLDLRSPEHPNRSISLNNLAAAIYTRFKRTDKIEDLSEAIIFLRQSLDLRPVGHQDRPHSLNNLSAAIYSLYKQTKKIEDLNESVELLSEADTTLPDYHPLHTNLRLLLADNKLKQHAISPADDTLITVFPLFDDSTTLHTATTKARFGAAREWVDAAQIHKDETLIRAYSTCLTLLYRYLITTPSVELQQSLLTSTSTNLKTLFSNAASAAIEKGQLETAVEFLERSMSMLWSELRGFRPELGQLRKVNPELADRFESLSGQLERYAMSFESESMTSQLKPKRSPHETQVTFGVEKQSHCVLLEELEEVVERIQKIDGFTSFLDFIPFGTLQKAAADGPVIIVNISEHQSDAIIIRHSDPPVLVPLDAAKSSDITRLSSQLSSTAPEGGNGFSITIQSILRELWSMIVHPVADRLSELGVAEKTRIWWCPTSELCALPLHAAGPYADGQKSLPDLYISSYTSTLSALIEARSDTVHPNATPNLLAVGDVGQLDAPTPSVEEELGKFLSLGDFVEVLSGEEANRDTILARLPQHRWVHFICHTHPEPFHSFFQLHAHERLELLDLMKARLPNAEFAFLSTCHAVATDTRGTSDEVIHLASAMQVCGYRSVVGPLWRTADIDETDVSGEFYGHMLDGSEKCLKDSAQALNLATKQMRDEGVPFDRWANFVHIGA